jgi:benzoyl-CoA reductase subunit C
MIQNAERFEKMDEKSEVLRQLAQASDTLLNPVIKSWKKQGGKVVGLFCSYIPEEIIYAAGILPFMMRARGSLDTTLGDAYLGANNCTFARHCLSMAFSRGYDFLDGVVCFNSCDHLRRLYDIWKRKLSTPFLHLLSVPHKVGEEQVEWYRDELTIFKESLEKHFSVEISDERLWQAIKIHNETRNLQRQLYALRKRKAPPITGAEALSIVVAGTTMPKDQYNKLLKELLEVIGKQDGDSDYRARLMMVGAMLDDPAYVKVFEDLGGLVVTDLLCFGTGVMWHSVDETSSNPMEALARYYLSDRIPCPRMVGQYSRRLGFIKDMVKTFKVDGVLVEQLKFCDFWGAESFLLRRDLQEADIPVLILEREYLLSGLGQLKTRIQAFLEIIQGVRVRR